MKSEHDVVLTFLPEPQKILTTETKEHRTLLSTLKTKKHKPKEEKEEKKDKCKKEKKIINPKNIST